MCYNRNISDITCEQQWSEFSTKEFPKLSCKCGLYNIASDNHEYIRTGIYRRLSEESGNLSKLFQRAAMEIFWEEGEKKHSAKAS